jgi:hypothetical protein
MPQPEKSAEHASARKGDKAAQEDDPHGVGKGGNEGATPAGRPSSDRHETETAAAKQ